MYWLARMLHRARGDAVPCRPPGTFPVAAMPLHSSQLRQPSAPSARPRGSSDARPPPAPRPAGPLPLGQRAPLAGLLPGAPPPPADARLPSQLPRSPQRPALARQPLTPRLLPPCPAPSPGGRRRRPSAESSAWGTATASRLPRGIPTPASSSSWPRPPRGPSPCPLTPAGAPAAAPRTSRSLPGGIAAEEEACRPGERSESPPCVRGRAGARGRRSGRSSASAPRSSPLTPRARRGGLPPARRARSSPHSPPTGARPPDNTSPRLALRRPGK